MVRRFLENLWMLLVLDFIKCYTHAGVIYSLFIHIYRRLSNISYGGVLKLIIFIIISVSN